MSDEKSETWLPNMVGGVSIWKLARDLNEGKFFDGRLLVPETEGSDSLPTKVRWNLTGLVPLADARKKQPEEVAAAVQDFTACLERAAKELGNPQSGYHKYKDAFTVPALEAGDCYFYGPEAKKLFVVNWGASPREFGGKGEFFFGYQDWGDLFAGEPDAAPAVSARGAAEKAAAKAPAKPDAKKPAKPEEKKKDEKKAQGGKPSWLWVLVLLLILAALVALILFLRKCEAERLTTSSDAGALAPDAEAGALGAEAGADAAGDARAEAGDAGDASADAADASGDAGDAGDASADGGDAGDAGKKRDGGDGGKAGGGGSKIFKPGKPGGQPGGAGGPGGQYVIVGPGGPGSPGTVTVPRTKLPHRRHFHPDAVGWQIAEGMDVVVWAEMQGKDFMVWLEPDAAFEEVVVQWQDANGQWHE